MNKIYKVIWSKTRNCYVAVAEFVKRNGKGGSVLNRRHIAAALAAVAICAAPAGALAANTGGHWDGDDYIGDAPYKVTINEQVNGIAYGRYETGAGGSSGATLSIVTGGKAGMAYGGYASSGSAAKNEVTIAGGTVSHVNGGQSIYANAKENKVTISGGRVGYSVYGGRSTYANAEENIVTISGGTVGAYTSSLTVHGGSSDLGSATKNKVTISGGTIFGSVFGGFSDGGTVTGNTITIAGGTIDGSVYGGQSSSGNAENNTVTIAGGTFDGSVYGGRSFSGKAENNTVTIAGGTFGNSVLGGDSRGDVANNTITISGGKLNSNVYGGISFDGGSVTGNTVILSRQGSEALPVINGTLFGGLSDGGGTVSENTLQVEAVGLSAPQIRNFENYRFVLPSDVKKGDTMLTLKGQGADLTIDASKVDMAVAKDGGLNIDFGESVTLLHKTGGDGVFSVTNLTGAVQTSKLDGESTGFDVMKYKLDKPDHEDKLNVTVSELYLYGDGGTNTPGQRPKGNTLTINDGKANAAFGGRATSGDVTGNQVTMSGGELILLSDLDNPNFSISGNLYGGYADSGSATDNRVEIAGGSLRSAHGGYADSGNATANTVTIDKRFDGTIAEVYGGYSKTGNATGNRVEIAGGSLGGAYGGFSEKGSAAGNQVDITGGTFGGVFGGFSDSGDATGNRVNITGSKVGAVFGGFSNKVVKYNTVIIGGGTFEEGVYGGFSQPGVAEKNAVTISDGTFENPIQVFGGYSQTKATDNAVNLTGTTTGLDMAELQGYPGGADFNVSHSGNELHIGGTKTYDKNGTAAITKGSWQGMDASGKHTNTVAKVANFDSIVLHNVVWGDVPALSAKNMENIGGLDVTDLAFYTHPDNSTVHEHVLKDYMVLVHSDKDDLTGLKISYLDEGKVKTEALTNQGIHYHTAPHSSTENGVTVDGKEVKRIFLADHNKSIDFFYHVTGDKITLGEVNFIKDGTARILDGRFDVRNAAIDADGLKFTNASRLKMAPNDEMTLVDAEDAIANKNGSTLQPFATKQLTDSYSFTPADGVIVAAKITGSLRAAPKNNGLIYKVNSNQADKLTFGSVDWKDSGALLKRPAAVTFAGAAVDTSEIHFKNLKELKGNAQMTLVSDFGGNPGSITGSKYKIGTTLEGEGAASLAKGDLIFTTKAQEKKRAQAQTHKTVMGMTAGLAALSGGTEQLSQGMETLMDTSDGDSGKPEEHEEKSAGGIFLSLGGRRERYEPGSHVTSNTWNGVLGISGGHTGKNGTLRYAAFAEHGRANFTLHSDAGRGDGTSKYTGGGLLAKWQNRHDVYVEGSIRAGRMHDTASDLLYDEATGQSYGYDVHANYIGGHVGFGKVFRYNNGRSLDVYGKYFHMKRDGVSFEAEGHYDLDSVTSSVLRVGARYGATDKKWNWYGGLAYEYEFDGKATGRADGAEIRAASIKGGSVRGELGLRMEATKTSPWKADIRLTGYAGKRRGIGGNVSVAYTF